MVKCLQMDGVDDNLLAPSMTFDRIVIDVHPDLTVNPEILRYLVHQTEYVRFTTGGVMQLSGMTQTGYIADQRTTMTITPTTPPLTKSLRFFARQDGGNNRLAGKLYNLKIYNGQTLLAHYDMSTGTVQDQSGNGRHATLTGGTWLDDGTGGGEPVGEDGSASVDTKQVVYQDDANLFDIRNILYQVGTASYDTKQVLYHQISSTSFDMLQEIFNDGQVGQTPFDMHFLLYSDGSILHDSRQVTYETGLNAFDLKQAIYESGEGKADIHLVLFADSSIHHDLIQSLYEDAETHFDTKQISFNPDQQKIGIIRLKGKRDLYVYLVAKQELFVPLKGGINMTMINQNFSMFSGDTKYITFPIEGAADLTGAVITWGVKPRSYSSVENVLVKSTGNDITVENGEVKIKLNPEDTELLNGTYHHECELQDILQNVSTVFTGLMTVIK